MLRIQKTFIIPGTAAAPIDAKTVVVTATISSTKERSLPFNCAMNITATDS